MNSGVKVAKAQSSLLSQGEEPKGPRRRQGSGGRSQKRLRPKARRMGSKEDRLHILIRDGKADLRGITLEGGGSRWKRSSHGRGGHVQKGRGAT